MKKTGDLNFAIFFTDVLLLKKKKKQVIDVTKFILVFPTFRLKQQSLLRTRCCMKSSHSVLKLLSNGT